MSACSLFERVSVISSTMDNSFINVATSTAPSITPGGPGPGPGGGAGQAQDDCTNNSMNHPLTLEKDYYGCFCLKFIVKNGSHTTEEKVQADFGQFGEVVDVRGPGLFSGLRGNHVYVRYIDKSDAEEALKQLSSKYHQLTPASISDVLPDNYGLYTISFYNKTGIPSSEVRKEFSKFGEVKNLTGSLDVKGGRVFVSYKDKLSAVQALQAFFFRKDRYPNMKFALPRCEKDYFGCYCLKFYNKSGDITEDKVLKDFGQFGEVVDVRGPGLFDVTGDDVYVRYKEKSSAEQALIELVGRYDSLCLAPPSDIQADKFGYFTITFVNDKCLSKSDVWYIFSKFGTVACVNGTFDCKKGRVFVSYKEKQGALNALETMLITKEYHLQVSKNSTVRKNDYNVVGGNGAGGKEGINGEGMGPGGDFTDFETSNGSSNATISRGGGVEKSPSSSALPNVSTFASASSSKDDHRMSAHVPRDQPPPNLHHPSVQATSVQPGGAQQAINAGDNLFKSPPPPLNVAAGGNGGKNGLVKFNRNVEKDIFGYYCLSFLNEDGDINEKKVRHDFGKFGEVVSVRGALGKQKGHVFVRFRKKEAAENCLNCLNSFPLSEMSELFGKYLFLSPATPRDIDCDMYRLYSISFLNLNMKTFREIRDEFSKFGEIVRLTSGGGGNTDELVSISYADKAAAIRALQTHFTNKEFPYLDIAKGSSLLLVNSSDSSDNEDNESDYIHHYQRELHKAHQHTGGKVAADPFHDPSPVNNGLNGSSDVVDELLKPLQSYFNIYRTGQYQSLHGDKKMTDASPFSQPPPTINAGMGNCNGASSSPFHNGHVTMPPSALSATPSGNNSNSVMIRSPDKNYRIKSVKQSNTNGHPTLPPHPGVQNGVTFGMPPPSTTTPGLNQSSILSSIVQNRQNEARKFANHMSASVNSVAQAKPTSVPLSATATSSSSSSTPPSSSQPTPEKEVPTAPLNGEPLASSNGGLSLQPITVNQDLIGYYSLSFNNKSKDLSERKVWLDFGQAKVARVRGLAGLSKNEIGNGENVTVSFASQEDANDAANDQQLHSRYPGLSCAPDMDVVSDKDGAYSIEFINSGMSGIREITNEFSKHGEVVKVMAGGAKNAVKKVTVSYADRDAAFAAVKAHANSKDFLSVDFARDSLLLREPVVDEDQ